MYYIDKLPNVIEIGRVGEKNFREVQIDMSAWLAELPEGIPSLVVIRPGDSPDQAYIAATTFDNPVLTWVVSESDTGTTEGTGSIQIWLEEMDTENQIINKRGKSTIVAVRIEESIDNPSPDIPAPATSWVEQVTAIGIQVTNDKNTAMSAKAAAETAQAKSEEWATGGSGGTPSETNNSEYFAGQAGTSAQSAGEYAEAAEAAKNAAEDARDKSPYVDATSGDWMVWNAETGDYVDSGVEAQGPQGEPGQNGQNGQDGADGQDGTDAYVWIKYAATQPTQDSDMKDTPDDWMGVCSNSASTAPTAYTSYTWYKIKGETGSVEDVYGDNVPITEGSSTTIKGYVDGCVNDLQTGLDIVINGNTAGENVTKGQFVTVRNSTISGIDDGRYKAESAVAAGTPFVAANLSAVTSGALNDLSEQIASIGIVQIANGFVGDTENQVTLTQSMNDFDMLLVGIIQSGGDAERYNAPPMFVPVSVVKKSNSIYTMLLASNSYFYYSSDTKLIGKGSFGGAILRVYGIKL